MILRRLAFRFEVSGAESGRSPESARRAAIERAVVEEILKFALRHAI